MSKRKAADSDYGPSAGKRRVIITDSEADEDDSDATVFAALTHPGSRTQPIKSFIETTSNRSRAISIDDSSDEECSDSSYLSSGSRISYKVREDQSRTTHQKGKQPSRREVVDLTTTSASENEEDDLEWENDVEIQQIHRASPKASTSKTTLEDNDDFIPLDGDKSRSPSLEYVVGETRRYFGGGSGRKLSQSKKVKTKLPKWKTVKKRAAKTQANPDKFQFGKPYTSKDGTMTVVVREVLTRAHPKRMKPLPRARQPSPDDDVLDSQLPIELQNLRQEVFLESELGILPRELRKLEDVCAALLKCVRKLKKESAFKRSMDLRQYRHAEQFLHVNLLRLRCLSTKDDEHSKSRSIRLWTREEDGQTTFFLSTLQLQYFVEYAAYQIYHFTRGAVHSVNKWRSAALDSCEASVPNCEFTPQVCDREMFEYYLKFNEIGCTSREQDDNRVPRSQMTPTLNKAPVLFGRDSMNQLLENARRLYRTLQENQGSILSIDTEGFRQHHSKSVVQIGISWVSWDGARSDTRSSVLYIDQNYASLKPIPPSEPCSDRLMRSLPDIKADLIALLEDMNVARRPVLLIAHDFRAELQMLADTLEFPTEQYRWLDARRDSPLVDKNSTGIILADTQVLYQCFKHIAYQVSLVNACMDTGVAAANPHNAANDAKYTLDLLEKMIAPRKVAAIDLT